MHGKRTCEKKVPIEKKRRTRALFITEKATQYEHEEVFESIDVSDKTGKRYYVDTCISQADNNRLGLVVEHLRKIVQLLEKNGEKTKKPTSEIMQIHS